MNKVGKLPVDNTRSYTCNMYSVGTSMSKFKNKLHKAAVIIADLLALNTAFNDGAEDTPCDHIFIAEVMIFS